MPSEQPHSPRPRSERRSGSRRIDETWIPGDLEPPPGDGAGAAAFEKLYSLQHIPSEDAVAEHPEDEGGEQ